MKELQPATFPLNEDAPFLPTALLYIRKESWQVKVTSIYDVTDLSQTLRDVTGLVAAESAATADTLRYKLLQDKWYKRDLELVDMSNTLLAAASGPLLDLGRWQINFAEASPPLSHPIEVRPVGTGRREDVFVKDSIPYFWDTLDSTAAGRLFKVIDSKRVEVARYVCKSPKNPDGMLAINEDEVHVVVAIATWIALYKRTESFR